MPKKIFLATENKHKIREFSYMAKKKNINIYLSPTTIPPYPEENGSTYAENAILKTLHIEEQLGLPSLADDSGIEVDFLNGKPGIQSSRYSPAETSMGNIKKLLNELSGVKKKDRSARFKCCLAYNMANGKPPLIFKGAIEGFIASTPSTLSGFGYDPIFFVPKQHNTFADMDEEIKNKISHRAIAFQSFLKEINNLDLLEDNKG